MKVPPIFWNFNQAFLSWKYLSVAWKSFGVQSIWYWLMTHQMNFFQFFGGHIAFHSVPCFGLLVKSPLGSKALFVLVTSGVTPLNGPWQLRYSYPYTCEQALAGFQTGIYLAIASSCETRQTLYRLSYEGSASTNVTFNTMNFFGDSRCAHFGEFWLFFTEQVFTLPY